MLEIEDDPEAEAAVEGPGQIVAGEGPMAQAPGFDLEIERVGDDLVLDWADAGAGATYSVWRSPTAGFAPGNQGATVVASGLTDSTIVVPNAAGGDDDFYRVRAEVAAVVTDSTIAGEVNTAVFPGLNEVGLSLFPMEPDTAGLVGALADVSEIRSWDPATQQFDVWQPWSGAPPLPVAHAESTWIGVIDAQTHGLLGQVPAADESDVPLLTGWNTVVLPLNGPSMMASEILAMLPDATVVSYWSGEDQAWSQLWQAGWGTDYELTPGMGVWVDMTAPGTWDPFVCGNGVLEGDEACDDGNWADGDGCQADCQLGGSYLFTVRVSDDVLQVLDTETLTLTDVGPLGVGFDFGELAWDSTNDTMWMIDGRPNESLYTVDTNTGAASLVGMHGITDLFGLAHDPTTDTLYGSGESPTGFYSMNTTTGAATFIGDPGMAADGLTYDPVRDQLVALAAGGGQLYAIDRATGNATVLSSEGWINNTGLAYDPVGDLYWAIDWSGGLYTYDPNDGYSRTQELNGLGAHCGLTYAPGYTP